MASPKRRRNNDIIYDNGSNRDQQHEILMYLGDSIGGANLEQNHTDEGKRFAYLAPRRGSFRSKWADKHPRPRLGNGPQHRKGTNSRQFAGRPS